ncbi:MAG: M28 family peptidase [Deltaproteobacteria bacterium]|nr:M28 family peptidase [Deltaproteobacteria bacterium]
METVPTASLASKVTTHLAQLCREPRPVGTPGNRAANELFQRICASFGFEVESAELPCLVWERGLSRLEAGSEVYDLCTGPYSRPCDGSAPLVAAASVEELERGGFEAKVLLVHGDLCSGQLMPKNFVFFNPESHQRIVRALEAARPLAIIAATGQNPELAGGPYPFPLLEDGDFDVPNAYLKDVDGARLLRHVGREVAISIDSRRRSATTPQLLARKRGNSDKRLVFFAHIDTKYGTPGALDNGAGVCALLGLAELLRDYSGRHTIELVPLNGEDCYGVPGQMHWLAQNEGRLGNIVSGFNVDGAGFAGQRIAVSFYECPAQVRPIVEAAMGRVGFVEGPQWPQGDHSILVLNGVPAVALTSENAFFISSTVAHTEQDTPEQVDPETVEQVARFLAAVAEGLGY